MTQQKLDQTNWSSPQRREQVQAFWETFRSKIPAEAFLEMELLGKLQIGISPDVAAPTYKGKGAELKVLLDKLEKAHQNPQTPTDHILYGYALAVHAELRAMGPEWYGPSDTQ